MNLELPKGMMVAAMVYDAQGRRIRVVEHAMLAAGTHILHWDGQLDSGGNAASGVYWIRVTAGPLDKRVKVVVVH